MKLYIVLVLMIVSGLANYSYAECSLDHFIIGVNADGEMGTADDNVLYVNSSQKYRHTGVSAFEKWYYPLKSSIASSYKYRIGEPGFDAFQNTNPEAAYTYDPDRCLMGNPGLDYNIQIVCIALSQGLISVHTDWPQFTIDAPGEVINHSQIYAQRGDAHMHINYRAVNGNELFWITWKLIDTTGRYGESKPFTLVFNREPEYGDLLVDGCVGIDDLMQLAFFWMSDDPARDNDYLERTDVNRDGVVNLADFAAVAANWLMQ